MSSHRGKVNARLEGVPKLIAGNKAIDLKVELNGKDVDNHFAGSGG
jgi:hypothetical protein